ncbi:MAG TPA: DUF72 domain-containing protein [Terriglobia bacterium]|nr:DUF72 domain-containing protein [Terriglobia bacterium]
MDPVAQNASIERSDSRGLPPPGHTIRIGPAGWSYLDWAGIAYPRKRPRGFHEPEYLGRFFDTIEINTSFYQPVRAETARSWTAQVRAHPRFQFTAKLWRRFTHDRDAGRDEERAVKQGLNPLAESGKLGALLLQFPWSFKWTKENREYLGALVMQFLEYPLVLEVRHGSWNSPEAFDLLGSLGVGFCNIDQPIIGRSLAPTAEAVGPVGYVRLHGRNYNQWFEHSEPHERYNYLYTMDELEPWVERTERVAGRAQSTFVITNNHFEAKGVANALEIKALITGKPVPVPETMIARYPELKQIAAASGPEVNEAAPGNPEQTSLDFSSTS